MPFDVFALWPGASSPVAPQGRHEKTSAMSAWATATVHELLCRPPDKFYEVEADQFALTDNKPQLVRPPQPPQFGESDLLEDETDVDIHEELDDFGFVLPPRGDSLGDSARAYAHQFEAKAVRRRRRFETRRQRLGNEGDWASLPEPELKKLLRKGLPFQHRPEVWWSVLGCEALRQRSPIPYKEHVAGSLSPKTQDEIERDLQRTFPSHSTFCAAAGRAKLRNVLRGYACYNPRVKYCQGLNFLAAMLVVVFGDEERAFWVLVAAIERLGVEGYYCDSMKLLRADVEVLEGLLAKKCPRVSRAFRENDVELISIVSEWYITWFSKCLPPLTTVRVWDTLFLEGFKVLFRIAVGVFRRAEVEVLRCGGFDGIMVNSKLWPRSMIEHNELLKASFQGLRMFRRRDLLQARAAALQHIEAEDLERHRRVEEKAAARDASRTSPAAANSSGATTSTGVLPSTVHPRDASQTSSALHASL